VATRTLSRRALRDQNDNAEPDEPAPDVDDAGEADDEDGPKPRARKKAARAKKPAKAAAKPRARKKAVKVLPVMFARWAVCDNGMKRVAVFEYRDRTGADARLAEIRTQKPGTFFLLLVKDPCDPPVAPTVPA
jgi:hypothetical protein